MHIDDGVPWSMDYVEGHRSCEGQIKSCVRLGNTHWRQAQEAIITVDKLLRQICVLGIARIATPFDHVTEEACTVALGYPSTQGN